MRLLPLPAQVLSVLCAGALAGCPAELGLRGDAGGSDGGALDAGLGLDAPRPDLDAPELDAPAVEPDGSAAPDAPAPPADAPPAPPIDAPSPPDAPPVPVDAPSAPDAPAPPVCPTYGGPTRPATCPLDAEVVVWSHNGWNALADAIAAEPSDCAEYWITITSVSGDSTMLRPGEAARMHARGETIHALAEFHYWDWNAYRLATGASWSEIGRLFRRRMVEAGYCVESGDSWGINEAPSGARLDAPGVRDGLEELVRALHDGDPGMPPARGAVFVINFAQGTSPSSTYKTPLEDWLSDSTFWGQMNLYVRFWAQEVYTDPDVTCVPGSTLSTRATRINEFTMHPARLAAAAPPGVAGTAETYFGRAYTPLLGAVWGSDGPYGHTVIPIGTMEALISEQIHATRLWADTHASPDGRIGFAFGSNMSPPEWARLGQRVARAIRGAYGRGAMAPGACYEGGASVHCDCSVSGAAFSTYWTGFSTW